MSPISSTPSRSGSTRSSRARRGLSCPISSSASSGSAVTTGRKPAAERVSLTDLSIKGSSSTTRTVPADCPPSWERAARRGGPVSCTTGRVKTNRAPRPGPSLSAWMRPPWASTIPLQMASPSPVSPAALRSSLRENLRNRRGRSSAGIPRPWSATETSTWEPLSSAPNRIIESSEECLAALESRLPMTWTMRLPVRHHHGQAGRYVDGQVVPDPRRW